MTITFAGLTFVRTCEAYPEQWDVFDHASVQVGYVRLRNGMLTVDCPICMANRVLEHRFGDRLKGFFKSARERARWLHRAAGRINEWRTGRVASNRN